MSFFGGGTDFKPFFERYGGAVISTTFDKYCYVTVRHLPPFFSYKTQIAYSKIESVGCIEEIEHPLVREAMRYLDMHELRISYDADLPAMSGLGTSSSFAVGLLNAFYALKSKPVTPRILADDAIRVEREMCRESGGIQDQIAASFGGMNLIRFSADGYEVTPILLKQDRKQKLASSLLLFFTGFTRRSAEFSSMQEESITKDASLLLETKDLVDEAYSVLISESSLDGFGQLMNVAWNLKRRFHEGITTPYIDEVYSRSKKAGAIGGKLLGAGGGGFLLLYAQPDTHPHIRRALGDLLEVPFSFEDVGTQVLYAEPEDWSAQAIEV